jgi:uncharacterized protein (TIGR04222 family)
MNPFFENPLANMYGPHFLLLYAFVIVLAALFVRFIVPRIINRKNSEVPQVPVTPDPYEMAYLRGGEPEVIKLVVFSLISRGYLNVLTNNENTDLRVGRKDRCPSQASLNELEKQVFSLIGSKEKKLTQILLDNKGAKHTVVQESVERIKNSLTGQGLLWTNQQKQMFSFYKMLTAGFVIAFGLYKLLAAFLHERFNVQFLVIIGVLGILLIAQFRVDSYISRKGMELLEHLRSIFDLKGQDVLKKPTYLQQLCIALFGVVLLEHTRYRYLYQFFGIGPSYAGQIYWDNPGKYAGDYTGSWGGNSCGAVSSCSGGGSCGGGCGGGCGGCG